MTSQLGFKSLIEEDEANKAIMFDGEMSKVQEFKKIKKPPGIQGGSDVKPKKQPE